MHFPSLTHRGGIPLLQLFRVFLFTTAVAAVYVAAAWVIVDGKLRRSKRTPPLSRGQVLFRRTILALASIGLACMAYGYFIEPYWPEVTHVRIESAKLPKGGRPIRLALLSDLHCESKPKLEERLPGIIAAEKPSFIVFTGDSINSLQGLPTLKRFLRRRATLRPRKPGKPSWHAASPSLPRREQVLLHARGAALPTSGDHGEHSWNV